MSPQKSQTAEGVLFMFTRYFECEFIRRSKSNMCVSIVATAVVIMCAVRAAGYAVFSADCRRNSTDIMYSTRKQRQDFLSGCRCEVL